MKKRLIALLLSLIMLLTCMGAALETVVDTADTAADAAEQTDTAAPAEPTGEDTTDAKPNDEPDASVEPTEDPDAEPSAEPSEQPTDATEDETPAEEAPVEDDDAVVDGEDTDAEPVEDEEDADTDEDADAEPVYPLVSFTNVAPFLDPVTGSGSSSIIGTVIDKITGAVTSIVDKFKGGSATPADNTEDTSGDAGSGETKGLNVSKTAAYNEKTGKYTITLEAYATGEKTTTVVTKSTPTDIILVLDLSSSMNESMGYVKLEGKTDAERKALADEGNLYYCVSNKYYKVSVDKKSGTYTYSTNSGQVGGHSGGKSTQIQDPESAEFYTPQTRLDALEAACTKFAESVAAKCTSADGTTVKHRIAVVGYNEAAYLYDGTTNKSSPTEDEYKGAFKDMSTSTGKQNVLDSIGNLKIAKKTQTDLGLSMANTIFENNSLKEGETRNRVVVLFTDGYPSTSGSDNFDTTIAQGAIVQANTLKNKYGATVYSVAVLAGADPTQKVTATNWESTSNINKVNLYLHNVSSNVEASEDKDFKDTPVEPTKSGYYLTAGSSEDLTKIFEAISQNIETSGDVSTTLDASSVVKDVISPQFTLPSGATTSDITIKTYKYNGASYDAQSAWTENSGDAMGATASISDGQVSVMGFNFSENWCGSETNNGQTTYRGNRLEISFDVVPKNGFLGGNDVLTNGTAGVYENRSAEKPTVEFVSPKVNVPIKTVSVTAQDKNVYLLGSVTGSDLKNSATVKVGDVTLNLGESDYGLQEWQTQYVDISVSVKDEKGNAITNLNALTDDAKYTVSVTVSPKTENPTSNIGETAKEKTGSGTANINVFKPVLTFKDSTAYYGESLPDNNDFSSNKVGDETWKHVNTELTDSSVTMLGTKPGLSISYTPDSNKISTDKKYTKQDVPVNVTVKINDTDVTSYTTFSHTDCNPVCDWKAGTTPGSEAFLIHIKTCTLTIKKTDGVEGESYVFTVYKDNEKYSEVAISGNGTAVIYELPVGNYTIVEDTGWSWRYGRSDTSKPSYNPANVTLSAISPSSTITCTNSNPFEYWLNGFSAIVRNIINAIAN